MTRKKTAEPPKPHRLTVDIPHDKGDELNALVKLTGIQKASLIRNAIFEKMDQMAKEAAR